MRGRLSELWREAVARGDAVEAFAHRHRTASIIVLSVVGLAALAILWTSYNGLPRRPVDPERIAAFQTEVDSLRGVLSARVEADSALAMITEREGEIVLGLRTELLRDIARWAARGYLDDVELHLRPDVTVEETGDVRPGIGPIAIDAGEWRIRVTIQRVEALLSLDSIAIEVADSSRFATRLQIGVSRANGDAFVDFEWDASTVGSVVCRDFEVQEPFGGVVPPFTYRVAGAFAFEARPEGVMVLPQFQRPRLRVRPQPTEESWERVSALLDEQNNIFRCGLALAPDDMIEKLERLLGEGFEFELPDLLFRPIRLPARVEDEFELEDRMVALRNEPATIVLTPEAAWFGTNLDVADAGRPPPSDSTAAEPSGGS